MFGFVLMKTVNDIIKTYCKGIEKQSNFCIFKIQDLYKNEYLCEN